MTPIDPVEEAIFHAASALPNPASRAAFLDSACGVDHELRARRAQLRQASTMNTRFTRLLIVLLLAPAVLSLASAQVIDFEDSSDNLRRVSETVGTIRVAVVRDGPTDAVSTMRYTMEGYVGTVPRSGQLRFEPGDKRRELTFTLLDDGHVSFENGLTLVLHNLEGATFRQGFTQAGSDVIFATSLYIDVVDNEVELVDPESSPVVFAPRVPAFSLPRAIAGNRDPQKAAVRLRRLGETTDPLVVQFSTQDGTARGGVHYVPQAGSLTFAALEVERWIEIPLLPGPLQEREVTLELSVVATEGASNWTNRTMLRLVGDTRPGSVDLNFDAGELGGRPAPGEYSLVEDLALLPDGRIYVGGHLESVQGIPRDGIARLWANGMLDAGFQDHSGKFFLNGDTHRVFAAPDGSVFGGYYKTHRFLGDGSGDASWTNQSEVVALLANGKVLAVLAHNDGIRPRELMRLHSDGRRDTTFQQARQTNEELRSMVVAQSDGKITLVVESFGPPRRQQLIRLLPDGARDSAFQAPIFELNDALGSAHLSDVVGLSDGRYMVAGNFSKIDGRTTGSLVRLHPDGKLDETFIPRWPRPADPHRRLSVSAMAAQADRKLLIGWTQYTTTNNPPRFGGAGLVRLQLDGDLDSSFDAGAGPAKPGRDTEFFAGTSFINRILVQPDGQILVSGSFTEFDGFPRAHLVRLNGDGDSIQLGTPAVLGDGTVRLPVFPGNRALETLEIQTAIQLSPSDWQPAAGTWKWVNGSAVWLDPSATNAATRFYRAAVR